ncbi:MAG: WecB/TagA/CpsF family glycosyltransferase [Desulfobacca sp.]|uniref:WecB/TagA/CpsF family glycosyltransferase n=1 Tax=Desulfobacca sp. TaxID=2067990 RepID=UPI00404A499A
MHGDHTVTILGVPVGVYTLPGLLQRLMELLRAPGCAYTYGVNAHSLNLAASDALFRQRLQAADVVYADGASLLLAARLLRGRLPMKITTTDLWPPVCVLAVQHNLRFYLCGGEPGLAERARERALAAYPGLAIVGVHDGFTDIFAPHTIEAINASRADIVWAGLGDPLQAHWAWTVRPHLQAKLIITCGGMFKIVAGDLQRVSPAWQQRGFEWLYRLCQEPQTWRRYLLGLPLFGLRVLRQAVQQTLAQPDVQA